MAFQELWEKVWKCEEAGASVGTVLCPFAATGKSLGLGWLFVIPPK